MGFNFLITESGFAVCFGWDPPGTKRAGSDKNSKTTSQIQIVRRCEKGERCYHVWLSSLGGLSACSRGRPCPGRSAPCTTARGLFPPRSCCTAGTGLAGLQNQNQSRIKCGLNFHVRDSRRVLVGTVGTRHQKQNTSRIQMLLAPFRFI